jgi:YlmC/YmxH family sporulation protein
MVINVIDGKALGRIVDIIFSRESSRVIGVVVPGDKGFKLWGKKGDVFVPYDKIVRIGLDVVLVELRPFGGAEHHSPAVMLT